MHTEICVINCWCTGISKNCFSPQNSRHVEDFKKLPDRLMQKKSMQQFFNKKKFCVSVIYLELDTKIMSLFSDCRRFVGRVTNLQQPQWVSSRIIALFSRALSSVNLTHSISDEEYVGLKPDLSSVNLDITVSEEDPLRFLLDNWI